MSTTSEPIVFKGKIGVFDSGIGGKSIANTLRNDYPHAQIIYVDDRNNIPYGERELNEIADLTDKAIQPLLDAKCDAIVLACNTATAAAIDTLRVKYPTIPFIGLEPMVKPASSLTKSGVIAICATPFTLHSERYRKLKDTYAAEITVLEPDCSEWAYLIEHNQLEIQKIAETIDKACAAGADVIVLACTHYHWIKEKILELSTGRAIVIDPSDAISRRVREVLGL